MDKPLSKSVLRVVQAEVQRMVGKDLDALKPLPAQIKALHIKVHNLQVDLSELKLSIDKVIFQLLENLQHPEHSGEVNAIIRQFLFEKHKK